MQKRTNLFFIFVLLLTTCYLLHATERAEASALSLSVSPPLTVIEANPPSQIAKPISIENLSDEAIDLNVQFMPFRPSNTLTGEISYSVDKDEFFKANPDIFDRIKIMEGNEPINTLTLGPKQKKSLFLNIDIGDNEPESDYYFSILFISKESQESSIVGNNEIIAKTNIEAAIAANILLSIQNFEKSPSAVIEEFSTDLISRNGPVRFNLKVKNTGDHLTLVSGQVIIKNLFGQPIGKIEIPKTYILANSERLIPVFWHESFLLGPYKSYLTLSISNNGPTFGRVTGFLGIPEQPLVGISIVIIAAVLILGRIKSKLG